MAHEPTTAPLSSAPPGSDLGHGRNDRRGEVAPASTPRHRQGTAITVTAVLPLLLIAGSALAMPGTDVAAAAASGPKLGAAGHSLLAVAVVLTAAHLGGALARRLGQPPVVGEICAGLALGPSLLGNLAPGAMGWLFPRGTLGPLDGLAQLGLILFMFGVGQELAGMRLRGAATRALLVSQSSVLVPFALGALVAVPLAARYAGPRGHGVAFVLFVGCALSITAFPVLARLLSDLGISRTEPGRLSLFAAAIGDGAGWLVLAGILATAHGSDPTMVLVNAAATMAVVALFLGPVKRLLARWASRKGGGADSGIVLVVGVASAAALTAVLGVHQLIGALLVGLVWPKNRTGPVVEGLTGTAKTVLLPFFFFGFGLTADLSALTWDGTTVLVFLGLLALATVGKVAGPGLCAWLTGMPRRPALVLGVLLNARGLTELIVIQIGYDAGIIDARMLAILTLVALGTTIMTSPLLRLLKAAGTGERGAASPLATAEARPKEYASRD
ncbi:Na(+)/H(+)-K(+) antiporter GerN [Streptomyces hundungensis]|uniref:Na(+)/H(+)-K(+) antiporter GerN n=1 Tax=Streptomyces hundungensis TaxID=1077946 RepID=A0A387HDG5_9ACTN|nr:cation:proton antiporter [Streptomyces hundungensis]AYG78747.1 Na(+)/H(+)-K(+) antiporter GerN [Streptomyces hundungensis]